MESWKKFNFPHELCQIGLIVPWLYHLSCVFPHSVRPAGVLTEELCLLTSERQVICVEKSPWIFKELFKPANSFPGRSHLPVTESSEKHKKHLPPGAHMQY